MQQLDWIADVALNCFGKVANRAAHRNQRGGFLAYLFEQVPHLFFDERLEFANSLVARFRALQEHFGQPHTTQRKRLTAHPTPTLEP